MNISLNIIADNEHEFRAALAGVAGHLLAPTSAAKAPSLEDMPTEDLLAHLRERLGAKGLHVRVVGAQGATGPAAEADPDPALAPAAETPKRRGRPPKVNPPPVDTQDMTGDAEAGDADGEPEPAPPPAPKMKDGDALAEAMSLLRAIYSRNDAGEAGVNELREKYGVKKFVDVPLDKAQALLADARALDAKTGG